MTTVALGVPVPKMLPVTGSFALPFGAYYMLLVNRIVYRRLANSQYLGDSIETTNVNKADQTNPDPLYLDIRAHANFLENVPLAFILAIIAELNGANRKALTWTLGVLFTLRVLHVEAGLKRAGTLGAGRPIAYYGTQSILAGLATYSAWLVKGYWGY